MEPRKVVVLGAGGLVAQRLQQRLHHHPWFEMVAIAGSANTAGQSIDSVPWVLDDPRPTLPDLTVMNVADPASAKQCREAGVLAAFCALPADAAMVVEPMWAAAGITVFSNASAHRLEEGVPLVVPEVNPDAILQLNGEQRLACATNCTLVPLLLPLAALHETFGLTAYTMRSEQGLSGGGHGYMVAALAAGEVHPDIPGEAEKTDAEFRRVMGWNGMSKVACARVMRPEGHLVVVEASFRQPVTASRAVECMQAWTGRRPTAHLPSAPYRPLVVVEDVDPNLHLMGDGDAFWPHGQAATSLKAGMAVVVGSVTSPSPNTVRFEGYSHNAIRGAAGGVVFLAEWACDNGLL